MSNYIAEFMIDIDVADKPRKWNVLVGYDVSSAYVDEDYEIFMDRVDVIGPKGNRHNIKNWEKHLDMDILYDGCFDHFENDQKAEHQQVAYEQYMENR